MDIFQGYEFANFSWRTEFVEQFAYALLRTVRLYFSEFICELANYFARVRNANISVFVIYTNNQLLSQNTLDILW